MFEEEVGEAPSTPGGGDVVSQPAQFPLLLHLLLETLRREQPVHSACWKELDLEVTGCRNCWSHLCSTESAFRCV